MCSSVVHTKREVLRVSEICTESQSTPWRSSQDRYSSKSSPAAPTRIGCCPRLAMPNAMLAATPPRCISRSSTRNDRAILSSWSTTKESANRPLYVIRWSVAMDPVRAIRTPATYPVAVGTTSTTRPHPAVVTRQCYRLVPVSPVPSAQYDTRESASTYLLFDRDG